ncbi:RmlC-like cupin [Plenodomus tracheiphilus IPT5]|uniref:RmlC-like cupin n=1 Tax=Plenodomus tracheiphilus IPT5 TaxID=1408161 RepID=A0A6A7AV71_9PLEO|nr:RmlC-like cupin [Plenodomus tracheiphilus IPT5]
MTSKRPINPVILHRCTIAKLPLETFDSQTAGGNVHWRTLLSAPQTDTDTFTVGVATCPAGSNARCPASPDTDAGHLRAHRHAHAELYYITSGTGVVTIDGVETVIRKGSVVFIPGDAEHGVKNTGQEKLEWLYVFAADGFGDIVYRFRGGGEKAKL